MAEEQATFACNIQRGVEFFLFPFPFPKVFLTFNQEKGSDLINKKHIRYTFSISIPITLPYTSGLFCPTRHGKQTFISTGKVGH